MICKCRRILLFFFFFFYFVSLFFFFFFYLPTKPENRQKNLSLPKKKSCLSCDLMSVHLYRVQFLFLGYVVMNCCKFVQFM